MRILATQPIYEEINGYNKEDPPELPPISSQNKSDLPPLSQQDSDLDTVDSSSKDNRKKLTVDVNLIPDSDLDLPSVSPSPSHDSESSSACSTLNRPRPIPRRRSSRKIESSSYDQPYMAMNRPSIAVALNENDLREILNQMTSLNLQTLRDIYTQYEKEFLKESAATLSVTGSGPIKFTDFDIYGKPLHSSERCIVYNAKLKATASPCQIMV